MLVAVIVTAVLMLELEATVRVVGLMPDVLEMEPVPEEML